MRRLLRDSLLLLLPCLFLAGALYVQGRVTAPSEAVSSPAAIMRRIRLAARCTSESMELTACSERCSGASCMAGAPSA